ncbi:MAG: hypothetical protein ABIH36_01805 [bacterium]
MLIGRITTRQLIIWRAGEVVLVIALVIVIAILSSYIQDARRRTIERYVALEQSLGSVAHNAEMREELSQREHDINRIKAFIPERQKLGEVVDALEHSAGQLGITVTVPQIKEEIKEDEEGNPIVPAGPLREVRLRLVASGAPDKTLRWLHAVEYQPYLLTMVDWRFATVKTISMPAGAGMPAPAGESLSKQEAQRMSTVEAEIIVTILVNEEDEKNGS